MTKSSLGTQPWYRRPANVIALVVGVITAVGVVISFLQLIKPPAESASPPSIASAPTSTPNPRDSQSQSEEPNQGEPSSDREPTATNIETVRVTFDEAVNISVGKKVGPKKWQLQDWGGVPTARISVAWQSRTNDNLEVESDTCEVLISLKGPTDVPSVLSDECSQDHLSSFKEASVIFEVLHAGTYTVTVREAVSGVAGTGTFIVVR